MNTTIKNQLKSLLLAPALVLAVGMALPVGVAVMAPDQAVAQSASLEQIKAGADQASGNKIDDGAGLEGKVKIVVDVLLFIVGAVSVIMLIYGGFKYITSAGDSSAVSSAKNTILYAVVGLIVALLAYAIIGYVINQFTATT